MNAALQLLPGTIAAMRRLPQSEQRRLDHLLRKNRSRKGLCASEKRELKGMLSHIDKMTLEMLSAQVVRDRTAGRIKRSKSAPLTSPS